MACSILSRTALMNDLDWLARHRFQELIRYEQGWRFVFDRGAGATAGCLWRLLEAGRIRLTSQDNGHKFGLPAPVDLVREVNGRLAGVSAIAVVLQEGTLDLDIQFETGHRLQFISDSSGYESWTANNATREFIAVGGGSLAVFDKPTPSA
jgi:hypothetical protein